MRNALGNPECSHALVSRSVVPFKLGIEGSRADNAKYLALTKRKLTICRGVV